MFNKQMLIVLVWLFTLVQSFKATSIKHTDWMAYQSQIAYTAEWTRMWWLSVRWYPEACPVCILQHPSPSSGQTGLVLRVGLPPLGSAVHEPVDIVNITQDMSEFTVIWNICQMCQITTESWKHCLSLKKGSPFIQKIHKRSIVCLMHERNAV